MQISLLVVVEVAYSLSHAQRLWPHWRQPARRLCPWDFSGKNSAGGCSFLLPGIFPIQGLNPSLLHCSHILHRVSCQGSPLRAAFQLNHELYQSLGCKATILWTVVLLEIPTVLLFSWSLRAFSLYIKVCFVSSCSLLITIIISTRE